MFVFYIVFFVVTSGAELGGGGCSEHFIHFEFPAIQFHSNWLNQLSFLLAELDFTFLLRFPSLTLVTFRLLRIRSHRQGKLKEQDDDDI